MIGPTAAPTRSLMIGSTTGLMIIPAKGLVIGQEPTTQERKHMTIPLGILDILQTLYHRGI